MSLRDELLSFQNEKKSLENKIFSQVLELCIEQIKYENEHSKTQTIYTIPKFIIGLPLNNTEHCINYLLRELKKKELVCKRIYNHSKIYISWKEGEKPEYEEDNDNDNDNDNDINEKNSYSDKKLNNRKKGNNYDKEDLKILSQILKKE